MSQEKFYSGVLKKKKYKLKFNLDNLIFSEFKKHEFYFKLFECLYTCIGIYNCVRLHEKSNPVSF